MVMVRLRIRVRTGVRVRVSKVLGPDWVRICFGLG